ncbi:zf-HC2 domain-containing protein [Cryptosporangium sp. NPDC051539]|uniref:zf-HC2 domain-containing protein n=1 Tax=Cryptosporangium sp. NPDC051539 TaxID=3363962 RepID=UPI0037BD75D2
MTEIQCRELVGAYAVGALEPPEAARLADHLLTCTRCRHELDEAEECAALMAAVPPEAFIDEPANPNDPLFLRTLEAIRFEAASTPSAQQPASQPAQRLRAVPGTGRPERATGGEFPGWSGQTPTRSHRAKRRAGSGAQQRRQLAWAGAAAAAVLVLGGGVLLGNNLAGGDDHTTRTTTVADQTADPSNGPATPEVGGAQVVFRGDEKTTGAHLEVGAVGFDTYTRLEVTGTKLPANTAVQVFAKDGVGTEVPAVDGKTDASGNLSVEAAVQLTDLQAVTVRTPAGETLVTAVRG